MARILKDYPNISLDYENLDKPINFEKIFGRGGPVHIEIGSGNGTFMLNQAKSQPQINFLGIEWARKYYRYAVDRMGRWNVDNVRIIRTEAAAFIAEFVPDSSIECFHIYYPDPWPKKRHHKRRFICNANIEQMLRCLANEGSMQIATDHLEYFEQIKSCLKSYCAFLKEKEFIASAGASDSEYAGTNYERKYAKENRQTYTIAVKKVANFF